MTEREKREFEEGMKKAEAENAELRRKLEEAEERISAGDATRDRVDGAGYASGWRRRGAVPGVAYPFDRGRNGSGSSNGGNGGRPDGSGGFGQSPVGGSGDNGGGGRGGSSDVTGSRVGAGTHDGRGGGGTATAAMAAATAAVAPSSRPGTGRTR